MFKIKFRPFTTFLKYQKMISFPDKKIAKMMKKAEIESCIKTRRDNLPWEKTRSNTENTQSKFCITNAKRVNFADLLESSE